MLVVSVSLFPLTARIWYPCIRASSSMLEPRHGNERSLVPPCSASSRFISIAGGLWEFRAAHNGRNDLTDFPRPLVERLDSAHTQHTRLRAPVHTRVRTRTHPSWKEDLLARIHRTTGTPGPSLTTRTCAHTHMHRLGPTIESQERKHPTRRKLCVLGAWLLRNGKMLLSASALLT